MVVLNAAPRQRGCGWRNSAAIGPHSDEPSRRLSYCFGGAFIPDAPIPGAFIPGAAIPGGGPPNIGAARTSFAACGSLLALAASRLTCHISVSESDLLKLGIPVRRIPLATFQ